MIGKKILQYAILEKLGEGGMGVVYKAHDTKLDRFVALKFLPHHLSGNETEKDRLLQEAKAAAALNHPNVCSVIDIQYFEGQQFLIMEYVDGSTLRSHIPVKKVQDALQYAVQIGEALQAAHVKGIVHRDVKSENIMLTSDGRIKVMDFGLAKLKGTLKLTKTSSTVGTLGYMAPEQLQGGTVDARSDIFSFGVVLFEMVTGASPFRGEHEAAIMYSIVNEDPESVLKYNAELSPELDRIIRRALEKDPADRYQHVDDMVSEVRHIQKISTRIVRPDEMRQSGSFRSSQPHKGRPEIFSVKMVTGVVSVLLVIAVAGWFFFSASSSNAITSMAVLPFVNVGSDQSTEYLSDGLTESMINSLSKIPGLKLMSRNSVFRYKGKDIDPRVVGKEMNVGALLMGRISQHGDALNVSVELVNTSDNSHIWGAQYDRKSSELIALQSEISSALSRQLRSTITADEEKEITKNSTENTEAYQLYLKGRFFWNKRTTEGFQKSIDMFQQAIKKDPQYALAYAGLADCYILMSSYFILPSSDVYPKAKAAAMKAIELDPTLAQPHATLAGFEGEYNWDFPASEREYRRSIELNPNYATSRQWFGEFLAGLGRYEEGLTEIKKAIELDPLTPILYVSASWIYYILGDNDQALANAEHALELDPQFPRAMVNKVVIYLKQGKNDDAVKMAHDALAASGNGIEYKANLGFVYGMTGHRREAERILSELLETSKKEFVAPNLIAWIYAGLGNTDKVFEWLEKGYQAHMGYMISIKIDPAFEHVQHDPRFKHLLQKIGLPQ